MSTEEDFTPIDQGAHLVLVDLESAAGLNEEGHRNDVVLSTTRKHGHQEDDGPGGTTSLVPCHNQVQLVSPAIDTKVIPSEARNRDGHRLSSNLGELHANCFSLSDDEASPRASEFDLEQGSGQEFNDKPHTMVIEAFVSPAPANSYVDRLGSNHADSLYLASCIADSLYEDDVEKTKLADAISVTDNLSITHQDGYDPSGGYEEHERKLEDNIANNEPPTDLEHGEIKTVLTQKSNIMSIGMKIMDNDWVQRKLQYVYVFAMLYATPVCIAIYAPISLVSALYFLSISCVVFVNCWMLLEVISSFRYTSQLRKLHHSSPEIIGEKRLGSIVVAYLPNELTVLVDTIRAVANTVHELPSGTTLNIVLAHNGGRKDQRIALLEDLRKIEPELPANVCVHELDVLTSRSKAENVNAALAFFQELSAVRGEIFTHLSIYDSDHQPIPQAWRYALETMQDQQADMVMGRCCVREGLKYVAIEFDILYAVAHAGGRCIRGFGFFGGSNGYWDYTTLVETGMDQGMLTEDIDSSFRAQASGHRMTYDPTIVSFEESPPDFAALFKQRLRWAQGWYEVTIRQFFLPFQDAPGLTLWSRFCIFLLLPFRELYVYLSSFTVPIAVVYLTRACGWSCVDYRLLALMGACMQVPVIMTLSAWYLTKDRTNNIHYRMASLKPLDYVRFILICFPYDIFKIHITVMSHARHALGLNKWVVTKRKTTKDPTAAIFTPVAEMVSNPDDLVANSPFAPSIRHLSSGTYYHDEDNHKWIHHTASRGSCPFRQNASPNLVEPRDHVWVFPGHNGDDGSSDDSHNISCEALEEGTLVTQSQLSG